MSNIQQRIEQDLVAAMKSKDASKVRILRLVKSALDAAAKDKKEELSDQEAISVIRKKIKQSQDSKEKYAAGGRKDLVAAEQMEIDLLSQYLPAALSPAEIEKLVRQVAAETGAQSLKDLGKVMGKLMKLVAGRAEGAEVKRIVEQVLGRGA